MRGDEPPGRAPARLVAALGRVLVEQAALVERAAAHPAHAAALARLRELQAEVVDLLVKLEAALPPEDRGRAVHQQN